ncbi:hypothetical protein, partial [Clostridium perfringens]
LAPIAKLLQGKLNTTIGLSGDLTKGGYTPNLNTVSGNALAEILNTSINAQENGLVSKLEGALGFVDFDKLNLNDLKANL